MKRHISVLLLASSAVFAQTADWRFIHPDAKAFVGIKIHRIMNSSLAAGLRSEATISGDMPDLSAVPGSDVFEKIDEIYVSSPGLPAGAPANAQPPLLMRITGRFTAEQVEALLTLTGAKTQKYRERRVFRQKSDGDMAATMIDAHTLLVGDAPSLFSALERIDWTDAPRNPLLARAIELNAVNDLWAVFSVPPSSFTGAQMPQFASLQSLRGMELAAALSDGLSLRFGLTTESAAAAAKLAEDLKQFISVRMQKDDDVPKLFANLTRNYAFDVDGATVRLQIRVSPEQMKLALAELHRQREEQRKREIATLRRQAATPPPAPVKRMIRIEGLDDGTREIEMK